MTDTLTSDSRAAIAEAALRAFPGRLGLSINEFAEALDFSRGHVKNLIQSGKIRVHRYGRRVIIPMDAAIAFMLGEN